MIHKITILLLLIISTNGYAQFYKNNNELKKNLQITFQPNYYFDNTFQKPYKSIYQYDGKIKALNTLGFSFQLQYQHRLGKHFAYQTGLKIANWKHHFRIKFPLNDFSPGMTGDYNYELKTRDLQRAEFFIGIASNINVSEKIVIQPYLNARILWYLNEYENYKKELYYSNSDTSTEYKIAYVDGVTGVYYRGKSYMNRFLSFGTLLELGANTFIHTSNKNAFIVGLGLSTAFPPGYSGNKTNFTIYKQDNSIIVYSQHKELLRSINLNIGYRINL